MGKKDSSVQDIYRPEPATIIRSEPMTEMERFFEFKLDSGEEFGHMPGQFAEVSVPGIGEAPISISSSPTQKGVFQMVVRKVGNVSGALHSLSAGAKVGIRGPFGTSFPVEAEMRGKDLLFVCGGIGLVPVRSAINYVLDNRANYGRVFILFGVKNPSDRLFMEEIERWKRDESICFEETVDKADESWTGNVGVITTLLPELTLNASCATAIVCGPPIMYKFVIIELHKMGFSDDDIFVSLERHMKCGVGKCGHCQVNGLYACQDGPVFKYAEVADVREAI